MRLFVAIEIPENIKDYMVRIQKRIDHNLAKIRLVNKESMHLTLKFLGEVQPSQVENIKLNLKKIKIGSFLTHLDSIGFFPDESYIRVMWMGLKPEDKIIELQKEIDEKLSNLFEKEKKFKPHLTLARVKFIENKKVFIEQLKKIEVDKKNFEIRNFKLIKSTLSPKGPIYEDLEVFG